MRKAALIAVVFTCLAALAGDTAPASLSAAIDVRSEDLLVQPPAANWISYNGDYSGRRFSGLSEINRGNLAGLRAEWVFHARQFEPASGYSRCSQRNDVCDRGERRLCPGRAHWSRSVAPLVASFGRVDRRRLRAPQSRRRSMAQPGLHGDRQRTSPLPGCALGESDLGCGVRELEQELRRNQRSARDQRQSPGGHLGRR